MTEIHLVIIPHKTHSGLPYQHLHIQILTENGIVTPADLKELKLP
jgi:CRISPR-associated protein Csx3